MLHIGANDVVDYDHIVAILDLSTALSSKDTRIFLNHVKKINRVFGCAIERPKSLVVACDRDGIKVIYSPVSAATLKGRLATFNY